MKGRKYIPLPDECCIKCKILQAGVFRQADMPS